MKVLLINGSARRHGNTFLALTEIANALSAEKVDSEIVQIGTKPIRGCIACAKCKQNANNKCIFNDDICNQISEKMQEFDALIIGSPVYYGQPNGALLALIQRMFFSAGTYFVGKPAAAITVCRRGGATAAFQTLNMPFMMMNMPIVTSQYWNIVYGRDEGQAALDTEGMQTMRTLAKNMAYILSATKNHDTPQYEPWQPMNFIR